MEDAAKSTLTTTANHIHLCFVCRPLQIPCAGAYPCDRCWRLALPCRLQPADALAIGGSGSSGSSGGVGGGEEGSPPLSLLQLAFARATPRANAELMIQAFLDLHAAGQVVRERALCGMYVTRACK